MELHLRFNKARRIALITVAAGLILAASSGWLISHRHHGNIPTPISRKLNFKPASVPTTLVKANSYQYSQSNKALAFTINFQGHDLAVTEQLAPDNLTSGSGVYFESLGLHPIARFESKAGPVAILNFYQAKTLAKAGTSGMLVAGKTMVIVNLADPKATITNDQWKQLFDNFKVDK